MDNLNPSEAPAGHPGLEPLPAPVPGPSAAQWIFVGRGGIRAGWRLLLFIGIAVVAVAVLLAPLLLFGSVAPVLGGFGPAALILGEGLPFLALLLSAWVMAGIEGRSLADYALPARGAFGKEFRQGALWGFVALTALLLGINAAHGFSFGALALDRAHLATYAFLWAAGFLVVGFFEEFLMRGYALFTLTTGIGFWPSAILLSVLFGSYHLRNPGENGVGALGAGFIGLFFCFTVRRTGNLWFAIGLHASWDYAQSFIYSVPDSGIMVPGHLLHSSFHGPPWLTGGTVGPEGSALAFVVIAAMFIVFDRLYPEARFPLVAKRGSHGPASEVNGPQPSQARLSLR